MAGVHNAITRGDLSSALTRLLGISRGAEGLERLGETLTPVIDTWGLPEWAILRGEKLAAIRMAATAVAAEFGIIALGNPAGSNNLTVVEAVDTIAGAAAMSVFLEVVADTVVAATLGAAAFPIAARDRRFEAGQSGQTRSFVKFGTDPGNTFGASIEQKFVPTTAYIAFQNLPVILRPGDDLIVVGQTVNNAFNANFKWRERQAYPGELG